MSRQVHQSPNYFNQGQGEFSMAYHTDMVRDITRVEPFRTAMSKIITPGMKVLECGCGTGILSIIAAQLGASVTSIEVDPNIAEFANKNFQKHAVNVKLIVGNATEIKPDRVGRNSFELIVAELMSIWCIEEPQVPVMNYLRKTFLAKSGIVIPGRIANSLAVGHFNFGNNLVQCRYPMARFTGVQDATIFTDTRMVNELNFDDDVPMTMSGKIRLDCIASGILNCVQISSLVELVPGVNFYTSDTLMPITIVPLKHDVEVSNGDKIEVEYSYSHRSPISSSTFSAVKVK